MRPTLLILLAFLFLFFGSCESEREIGTLPVKGMPGVWFKLYQTDEFNHVTPIDYQIIGVNNKKITTRKFLTGTDNYESDLTNFTAHSYDSIIYLTYRNPLEVIALYDLKTGKGYPNLSGDWRDDIRAAKKLLKVIQKQNPDLYGKWNK